MSDDKAAKGRRFRVAVLCGGPSGERGISLNSARSVCDHLDGGPGDEIEIGYLYYRDLDRAYPIERAQLYSNTPLDFDFRLSGATPLGAAGQRAWLAGFDLVLPIIHGALGEDGQIQRRLEVWGLAFLGTKAAACEQAYPKHGFDEVLGELGLHVVDHRVFRGEGAPGGPPPGELWAWLAGQTQGVIVKPRRGGSSLGVTLAPDPESALAAAHDLIARGVDREVIFETPLAGREFTVLVLEGRDGEPVALVPTEIELRRGRLFSYQRKYLASEEVAFHCPPRFDDATIGRVGSLAERLFARLGLRHFARLDGWILPDGAITFSDINPISGMEQNSFLFQQTSRLGMSHRDTLRYLLERASAAGGGAPRLSEPDEIAGRVPVRVLGGGVTAEREVSIMSATNVWLKLRGSRRYAPSFHLLASESEVWSVPYSLCLSHTVREIHEACEGWGDLGPRVARLAAPIAARLGLTPADRHAPWEPPVKTSLDAFVAAGGFVFLGLHGGIGEDGRLQATLARAGARHNGSKAAASALCIDKKATGEAIRALGIPGLMSLSKEVHEVGVLRRSDLAATWAGLVARLGGPSLVVKPVGDGCSAGVCRLDSAAHLSLYLLLAAAGARCIPEGALRPGEPAIAMPDGLDRVLFERFVETDRISVEGGALGWEGRGGWVEVTCGVLGPREGLRALTPSITVAEGVLLSLEEKFQGGTGVNITPPPEPHVSALALATGREHLRRAAVALGIEGYARLDAFLHRETGEVIVIEANTLPGLSPSTVLFHQGLAERPPLFPRELLEAIVDLGEGAGEGEGSEPVRRGVLGSLHDAV